MRTIVNPLSLNSLSLAMMKAMSRESSHPTIWEARRVSKIRSPGGNFLYLSHPFESKRGGGDIEFPTCHTLKELLPKTTARE